jgi:hypothetical protein
MFRYAVEWKDLIMYLETLKVSRKTPGDGKLQVTVTTFRAVEGAGSRLTARVADREAACGVSMLECSCTKYEHPGGAGKPHRHYFLESTLFHALTPDSTVRLDLDGVGIRVLVTVIQLIADS